MSAGNGSGKASASENADVFGSAVWIYTHIDGKSMVAMVEGSDASGKDGPDETALMHELSTHRSLCVTLVRKYVLTQCDFPMPQFAEKNGKRVQVGLTPAFLVSCQTHESRLYFCEPFETHAVLHSVTFLSSLHQDDFATIKQWIVESDESQAQLVRMRRSNLVAPTASNLVSL